jgi:hypothetical protein
LAAEAAVARGCLAKESVLVCMTTPIFCFFHAKNPLSGVGVNHSPTGVKSDANLAVVYVKFLNL